MDFLLVPSDFLLKPFDFLMIAIGVPCGSFWFPFDVPVKPFHFLLLPCVGSEFSTPPPNRVRKIIYRWHKGQPAPTGSRMFVRSELMAQAIQPF